MKDDLISRQDAIRVVSGLDSSFVKYIEELPSVQPEPCEDCVSRKAVIRLLHSGYHSKSMIEEVKELPPAQPEIIRCRDCRKYRRLGCPMGITVFDAPDPDGYCYKVESGRAERRTDAD